MKESVVDGHLTKTAKANNGISVKLTGLKGIPDRLVILPGPWIAFVETKRPVGGVISKLQIWWHNFLRSLGCNVYVIKDIDGVRQLEADYKEYLNGK